MAISKIILNGVTQMDLTADTVAANNLIAPNTAHGADGQPITGTASGGSSGWTKVAETSYQVSTTSTSTTTVATWETGHSELWTSDKIVYVRVRDTAGKRTGYFYGTDAFFLNFYAKNSPSSQAGLADGLIMTIWRVDSTGNYAWRYGYGTTGYGVYPDQFYSDGRIRIRSRYNSNYSLTINGTYKVEVFLLDPPTGATIFS